MGRPSASSAERSSPRSGSGHHVAVDPEGGGDLFGHRHLDAVLLAVVEDQRPHRVEFLPRPVQRRGRIDAAGKQDDGSLVHGVFTAIHHLPNQGMPNHPMPGTIWFLPPGKRQEPAGEDQGAGQGEHAADGDGRAHADGAGQDADQEAADGRGAHEGHGIDAHHPRPLVVADQVLQVGVGRGHLHHHPQPDRRTSAAWPARMSAPGTARPGPGRRAPSPTHEPFSMPRRALARSQGQRPQQARRSRPRPSGTPGCAGRRSGSCGRRPASGSCRTPRPG